MKLFFLCLLSIFSLHLYAQDPSKQELWDSMAKEVDSWVDGQGKPIDPGIRKTVIVFNLLGIPTRQSCEGHLESGHTYPWIDFNLEDDHTQQLFEAYAKVLMEINEEYNKGNNDFARMDALFKKEKELELQVNQAYLAKLTPLYSYLTQFYAVHKTNYDKILIIDKWNLKNYSLLNLGGLFQDSRSEAVRSAKLKEYQLEMQAFTDYLTDYFFGLK